MVVTPAGARRAGLVATALLAFLVPAAASAAPRQVAAKLSAASAPKRELRATGPVMLPGGATVYRFQQRVDGNPVLGAQAVVNQAPGARPRLAADSTRPAIKAPEPVGITRDEAREAASRAVGVKRLRGRVSAALAIQPGQGGELVWRVLIPAARPLGDFEVLVDAGSGTVRSKRNMLEHFQSGSAKLFNPNPVVEHGGAKHLRSDHHDRDTPLLTRLRRKVTLPNIDDAQDCLRGRWVHALRGRNAKETCSKHLSWNHVTRSNDRFEALMVYFHINRSQAYVQYLGFSDSNPSPNGIDDQPQRAEADALKADNSFYSPLTGVIKYGAGGVDDAEDADVILHEYGHALQASESPAFAQSSGFQAGALAEGSSDYWAAAMSSLSPDTANEDNVCIFDWDATTYGTFFPAVRPYKVGRFCGRRADVKRTLQKAEHGYRCGSDVHCVGQVWSSALWALRRSFAASAPGVGATSMDRLYLASQFLYTGRENFKGAAKALLCADEDLYPKGPPGDCRGEDYAAIHHEMHRRGIL